MWYEIKVNYNRQTGENVTGKVKETYIVDGVSCSDVETRLLLEIQPLASDTIDVNDCKRVKFYDIIPNTVGDYWYKVRVDILSEDNDGKEKRKGVNILVQAEDIETALTYLEKQLSAVDCEITGIVKSTVVEVINGIKK